MHFAIELKQKKRGRDTRFWYNNNSSCCGRAAVRQMQQTAEYLHCSLITHCLYSLSAASNLTGRRLNVTFSQNLLWKQSHHALWQFDSFMQQRSTLDRDVTGLQSHTSCAALGALIPLSRYDFREGSFVCVKTAAGKHHKRFGSAATGNAKGGSGRY